MSVNSKLEVKPQILRYDAEFAIACENQLIYKALCLTLSLYVLVPAAKHAHNIILQPPFFFYGDGSECECEPKVFMGSEHDVSHICFVSLKGCGKKTKQKKENILACFPLATLLCSQKLF